MEVEYKSKRNADILIYSGVFIYDNEVVAVMLFNFL